MQIPTDTPIGFIGLLMLVVGLFLLLTGFSIVKIQMVTVTPGRSTWGIGLIFFLIGIALVVIDDPAPRPPSTGTAAELRECGMPFRTTPPRLLGEDLREAPLRG